MPKILEGRGLKSICWLSWFLRRFLLPAWLIHLLSMLSHGLSPACGEMCEFCMMFFCQCLDRTFIVLTIMTLSSKDIASEDPVSNTITWGLTPTLKKTEWHNIQPIIICYIFLKNHGSICTMHIDALKK